MKSIVFDMDGVVFDTERICLECWRKQADKYGLKDIDEVVNLCIGTNAATTKKIVNEHYGDIIDYDSLTAANSIMYHDYVEKNGLPMKEGVIELLDYLKGQDYKIGMASSTRVAMVEKQLKDTNIRSYFDVVVGGDLIENGKPAPDIYLMACDKMGVVAKDTYAIEDSYNGIRSAYAAGMKPIMVIDMLPPTEEMKSMSIMVLKSLLELVGKI